jgi:GGDEF domain-containing protein
LRFEVKPGQLLQITISIGAAIFPHDGDSYETLLATADSRMYRDKTRRKRGALGAAGEDADDELAPQPAAPASVQNVSDVDLKRSATGLL